MLEPEASGRIARAKLVSMSELPDLVNTAIKNAVGRLDPNDLVKGPLVKRWEIVGRYAKDLAAAQRFADAVSANVSQRVKVEPAVLQIGKKIICGFIEPPNIPLDRPF